MADIISLAKIHEYQLIRTDTIITIRVSELLSGPHDIKFVAVPYEHRLFGAKNEYWGSGNTTDEALQDCLSKIENINISVIFEREKF